MVFQQDNAAKRLQQLLPMAQLSPQQGALAVSGLTIDSRQVQPGYLFVAVQGISVHGKQFVTQAATRGAVAVLVDAADTINGAPIPVISIDNLDQYLSYIAACFYGHPSHKAPVTGITGTNGKTTCSQLLAQALAYLQRPCGVVGTLGYGLLKGDSPLALNIDDALQTTGMTTPDAIVTQGVCAELVEQGAEQIVMEVSSHGLSQYRVAAIDIKTAIFTNLSHDHLDYHGTMEDYGAAKAKLFAMPSVNTAVINQDDAYGRRLLVDLDPRLQVVSYSLESRDSLHPSPLAHFSLDNIQMDTDCVQGQVVVSPGQQWVNISTQLVGHFNLSNLLAVLATLYSQGHRLDAMAKVLPQLSSVPGRMELVPNALGIRVLVDYAHTPDALKNTLAALKPYVEGRLWCVFGCGGDRDRQKRPQMAAVAEGFADQVIVTSDNPRSESPLQIFADIEKGFSVSDSAQKYEMIADRATAIQAVIDRAAAGDTVLIAGKGHEDYQLIGHQRFPFSDQQQARFNLCRRESGE